MKKITRKFKDLEKYQNKRAFFDRFSKLFECATSFYINNLSPSKQEKNSVMK